MKQLRHSNPASRNLALVAVLVLFGLGGILPACAAQNEAAPAAEKDASEAVAKIGEVTITYADLEEAAAPQLKQLEAQKQKIMEAVLDQVVQQKLVEIEAEARGVTPEELQASEVEAKVTEVTDEEVDAWYEQNKERVNQPKEQVADRIKDFLRQQRSRDVQNAFLEGLRDKHEVRILLEPMREEVEVAGAPTKGPENAAVTIIEFSDFECPFCGRVNPTLAQVRENYGDKVRIAFRHFPLAMHPNAQKAAEAAICAQDQGKFWEMHDAMFADQRNLGVDSLKAKAAELELDTEQFNQCIDSGKHGDAVAADMQAGQEAGVTGTPALFVNGRLVAGAVPYEQLAQVIDDELARKGSK